MRCSKLLKIPSPYRSQKNKEKVEDYLSLDVVAVFKAPSPEMNPDSPLPVKTTVGVYATLQS